MRNLSVAWCLMAAVGLLAACTHTEKIPETTPAHQLKDLTQYVDPYIGSGFHGHVFVGANVPFGAVQVGPTQITSGWDWCSGYHYSDSILIGFSHTHLSGTGIGDLGDVLLMPTTGNTTLKRGERADIEKGEGYGSKFSHTKEQVTPGHYAVTLLRYGIEAELTATTRVGMHRYNYPAGQPANLIVDLAEGIGWDKPTNTHIEKVNDSTLVGYRFSSGWAKDQRLFFAIKLSVPVKECRLAKDLKFVEGDSATATRTQAVLTLDTKNGEPVLVKVGISPVSAKNALLNIEQELPHWNFDQVAKEADQRWNEELNKVQVETGNEARKRTFYTALYHTMIAPAVFNDVNGDYRGSDQQVYHDTTFTNYSIFSLWDTYRGAHPLYTILQPERVDDMMTTMLKIYEQQGFLPIWHLMGNETYTMPGNSAFPILADAALKGFKFNHGLALDAMKASVHRDYKGLTYVLNEGYIPAQKEVESVAKGLEYSIDDWSAAQLAKKLGREEDYKFFEQRGQNYRHYFDPATRFMRGKVSEDTWRTPFNPFHSQHRADDYAEGNAWQYTWLVPQDVEGLIDLMGGDKAFIDKLDSLFTIDGDMGDEASSDITGLIGQYAHGNEPSHHITYLYAYAGEPWKTAEKVRFIIDSLYTDKPDGLCGNEDVGQMSSWYILSAMGFYPVNPANGAYVFGSPAFDEATIHVAANKTFKIKTQNNGPENVYIQQITLNGEPYTKSYIRYEQIMEGGELMIEMGKEPSKEWGVAKEDRPQSKLP